MDYSKFREIFKKNHKQLVADIENLFSCCTEDINSMLANGYIVIAGGYVRRLYMVVNNIPMTDEDIRAYFDSDVDIFHISSSVENKKSLITKSTQSLFSVFGYPSLDERPKSLYSLFPSDMSTTCIKIYNKNEKGENSTFITFKPIKSLLPNLPIKNHERWKTFYVSNLIVQPLIDSAGLLNVRNVSSIGADIPERTPSLQLIKVSPGAIKKVKGKNSAERLISSFDMSQTKLSISRLDENMDNTIIINHGANTHDMYECDISHALLNNINIVGRIIKYTELGMKFSNNDLTKLLESNDISLGSALLGTDYYV